MPSSDLAGRWTYRSFRNNPAPVNDDPDKLAQLLFAEAEFRFEPVTDTSFKGVIDWGSGGLDLAGIITAGSADTPVAFAITGLGRPGSETDGWQYDYNGCIAHQWPNGIDQVPALVGSVIRVKRHGESPAGYSASFIAVKWP
ncbi:MAG TPA: hypothetical protein VGC77_23610 [Rhodopseudomonas sp.]|uniref:hypothetical protein n=1 Tax=Rhodopseudomonas sp. TaxID=1078 RepID=UPI002ED81401